jgi:hypothetical protein
MHHSALVPAAVLVALTLSCGEQPTPAESAGAPQSILRTDQNPNAALQGTTLDGLRNAGWDCQQRGPLFISCAPPGIGLPPIPSLGEDGRPVYELAVFELDGTPIGSAHFLRADLYHGQTCAFTGQPFVFREIIGYYECFRTY